MVETTVITSGPLFDRLNEETNGSLVALHSCCGSDGTNTPKNYVAVVDANSVMSKNIIPKDFMTAVASFKIAYQNPDTLRQVCKSNQPALLDLLRKLHSREGPSVKKNLVYKYALDEEHGMDRKDANWEPTIGESGGFQIVQSDLARYSGDTYLVVSTAMPQVAKEMRQFAKKCTKNPEDLMTVKEFTAEPRLKLAEQLARRNVCRAAVEIAKSIGVTFTQSLADDEMATSKRIKLAVPNSFRIFNHLKAGFYNDSTVSGRDTVAIFNNCSDPCSGSGNVVVSLSPIEGAILSPISVSEWFSPSLDCTQISRAIPLTCIQNSAKLTTAEPLVATRVASPIQGVSSNRFANFLNAQQSQTTQIGSPMPPISTTADLSQLSKVKEILISTTASPYEHSKMQTNWMNRENIVEHVSPCLPRTTNIVHLQAVITAL